MKPKASVVRGLQPWEHMLTPRPTQWLATWACHCGKLWAPDLKLGHPSVTPSIGVVRLFLPPLPLHSLSKVP
jgi:hypothetical protein